MHTPSHGLCGSVLFAIVALFFSVLAAPASYAAADELSCQGDDPLKYTIYGSCPKQPMQRYSTKCEPIIGRYSDSLFVPIGHPDDKKIPYQCRSKSGDEYTIGSGTPNDAYCGGREVGDDQSDTGALNGRINACKKIFTKGNVPCLWRLEDGMCAASSALAASANPSSPGTPKTVNGTAELLCETLPRVVPHGPKPYADPKSTGAVVWDVNPYEPLKKPSLFARLLGAKNAEAISFSGFTPPKQINTAGGFLQQVSRQFQPSSIGIPGLSGGGDPSAFLMGMLKSFFGGGGFQMNSKTFTDIFGNRIGDAVTGSRFKSITGFAKSHIYDRDAATGWRTFAVMQTPPYGTYDPSIYTRGQELRMALELAEKTPEEILQAKRDKNPLVKNSYAFVTSGSAGDLMKKVLPFSHQFGSNDKVLRFFTGGEMSLDSFFSGSGMSAIKDFNLKDVFTQPLAQMIKPAMDISALKQTKFAQIFDPSSMMSPFDKMNKFPLNDHYSSCLANAACKVTEDYKPFNIGAPYHSNALDSYRSSGTMQKVIRTNLTTKTYREFNGHAMQRITYNRMCRANSAPKPCAPWIPCWSILCWGVPISAETPPCATRHDPVHDIGFPAFCYGTAVKTALTSWMSATGAKVDLSVRPKRADDIAHQTAKCMPMINKVNMVDVVQLAGNNMTALEGGVFRQFFGNSRPYPCRDETGVEHGQAAYGRPNLFSDAGANLAFSFGRTLQEYTRTASLNSVPELAIKDDGTVGIVSSAYAQGGGGGAGGGTGAGPCLGGLGGETGNGCGDNGIDPHGSMTETLIAQRRMGQWFGLLCLPKVERAYGGLMAETGMIPKATGAVIQRLIDKPASSESSQIDMDRIRGLVIGDAHAAPYSKLRSMLIPNAACGFMQNPDASKRYPKDGGCNKSIKTGLNSLVNLGEKAGGAVILLPTGGAQIGGKPGLPNAALVLQAGQDSTGKFIDVLMTNVGTSTDSAGLTQGVGRTTIHRMRENNLSQSAEQAFNKIRSGGPIGMSKYCDNGLAECLVPWGTTEWFHMGDSDSGVASAPHGTPDTELSVASSAKSCSADHGDMAASITQCSNTAPHGE